MSQQINNRVISRLSGTDQSGATTLYGEDSTGQYLLQMEDGSGNVIPATLDAIVTGVQMEKPLSGGVCQIAVGEVVKVRLGDTVTLATPAVVSDANGRAIPAAANHNVYGIVLTAGVVGDVVDMLVRPYYKA